MSTKRIPIREARLLLLAAALAVESRYSNAAAQQPSASAPPAVDATLLPYASIKDSIRLPDGRTIHMVCMGQGSPVVILTTGSGDWSIIWNKIQPTVAEKTRVCAWDRPGFGLSSPSPKRQTADNRTTDLQAALKAGGVAGPYVVVGHSLGGYESLLLKDREPSKVVGMVLVDPSVPDQVAVIERAAPIFAAWDRSHPPRFIPLVQKCVAELRAGTVRYGGPDPDGCMRPSRPPNYPPELRAALDKVSVEAAPTTYAAELETLAFYSSKQLIDLDSKAVIKPDRDYGNMPLIVLTAGDFPPPPDLPAAAKAEFPSFQTEFVRAHDALAALSTRGVNRVVPDTTHYIQQIKPQTVIDAINDVVDEARASGPTKVIR